MYPAQRKMADMLAQIHPGTADYRRDMTRALLFSAYMKRKSNFILTYTERDRIPGEELFAAILEMTAFLDDGGISSTAERERADYAFPDALKLFDSFGQLLDALLPDIQRMMVFLRRDGLQMTADCAALNVQPETPLPVTVDSQEGLMFLTVQLPEGGGAA